MPWKEPNKGAGETKRSGLVISRTERLRNSATGNPRYRVYFTDGSIHETSADASVNYDIRNFEALDVKGKPIDVTLTRVGRIIYARHTPETR